ncbi:unnamed protein product [Linum tenue]|uniref:Uncharacterized protein n=1 Tax=Linum tenue TaxID=586396 RepID=A0AAV0PIJ4_9ROSI|nr:unnamed protein product [Linum tenue]
MEGFDFHSLARKDLQALCKQNKIPANLTNVAMADSLQALQQVEGLDELIEALKSDPHRSPGKTVPGTPVVPPSGRRSTVRSKPAIVEPVTRTRRTTRKTAAPEAGAVAETPVTAVSRRKVPVPEASKFSLEGEGVGVVEKTKAASVAKSVQKGSSSVATSIHKDEKSFQNVYSSRRSVRLLEKSMAKICLNEGAAAGDDSSIAPKEETHVSCGNLDSLLENESEIQEGVSADHANISSESVKSDDMSVVPSLGSQEENVDMNSEVVEPLPKADYHNGKEAASNVNKNESIDETVSLEDVEKTVSSLSENETGMNCDLQADEGNKDEVEEKQYIDPVVCDNVQDHEALKESEPDDIPMELSNPDASSIGNRSPDTETKMDAEVQLNGGQLAACAENMPGSPNLSDWSGGSFDEWLAKEQQKNIDEAGPAAVSTPRPALKSIVVMGSNSHHVSSAALQVSEDTTSPAVTETKPMIHTDEDSEDHNGMKLDGIQGDIEVDSEEVVVTITQPAAAGAASLISGNMKLSSPFAADALQGQFPRPSLLSANKQQTIQKNRADISSEINKENVDNWEIMRKEETGKDEATMTAKKEGSKELEELSMRQLEKMLKEKLQLANKKTEKQVEEKRQAMQRLPENRMPVGETDRKN